MPEYVLSIRVTGRDEASGPLGTVAHALGNIGTIAGGILTANVLMRVGEGIAGVAGEAFKAAGEFQALQIRLEGLIARELRTSGQTQDMGEAFRLAVPKARELLDWIKEMAVSTPFTVESLTRTLSMSMAMGMSTEQAKELTKAVGTFTAGMGLSEWHMERIIFNFGQMHAMGKVQGRDLRDLTTSMVPVNDLLAEMAKKYGVTTEKMREMASKGKVPVKDFIDTFVRMAERDFPNAAARMARTFPGVMSNIKDFVQAVLGAELLGPALDRATGLAADALERLMSPEVRAEIRRWGQELGEAFERGVQVAGTVVEAFGRGGVAGVIELLGTNIGSFLAGAWPKVESGLKGWATNFWNWLTGADGVQAAVPRRIGGLMEVLEPELKARGPGVAQAVMGWAGQFWNWITGEGGVLATLGMEAGKIITGLVNFAQSEWPKVETELRKWGQQFWTWVKHEAVPLVNEKMAEVTTALNTWAHAEETKTKVREIGRSLVSTMLGAMQVEAGDVEELQALVGSLVSGLIKAINQSAAALGTVADSFVDGVVEGILEKAKGVAFTARLKNHLGGQFKLIDLRFAGEELMAGLLAGMIDAVEAWAKSTIPNLIGKKITGSVRDAFKIRSASRVMADEIGQPLGAGIALGIGEAQEAIAEAASEAIQQAMEEVRDAGRWQSAARGLGQGVVASVIGGLWDKVTDLKNNLNTAVSTGVQQAVDDPWWTGNAETLGKNVVGSVIDGLWAKVNPGARSAGSLPQQINAAINESLIKAVYDAWWWENAEALGKSVIGGIISGMWTQVDTLAWNINAVIDAAITKALGGSLAGLRVETGLRPLALRQAQGAPAGAAAPVSYYETITVTVNDRAAADYLLAMVEERRKARLNESMGG